MSVNDTIGSDVVLDVVEETPHSSTDSETLKGWFCLGKGA